MAGLVVFPGVGAYGPFLEMDPDEPLDRGLNRSAGEIQTVQHPRQQPPLPESHQVSPDSLQLPPHGFCLGGLALRFLGHLLRPGGLLARLGDMPVRMLQGELQSLYLALPLRQPLRLPNPIRRSSVPPTRSFASCSVPGWKVGFRSPMLPIGFS